MAWITTIEEDQATGPLKSMNEGLKKELGFVPNLLKTFSIDPNLSRAIQNLLSTLMFGPSELTRAQRESIALVVSVINVCHY